MSIDTTLFRSITLDLQHHNFPDLVAVEKDSLRGWLVTPLNNGELFNAASYDCRLWSVATSQTEPQVSICEVRTDGKIACPVNPEMLVEGLQTAHQLVLSKGVDYIRFPAFRIMVGQAIDNLGGSSGGASGVWSEMLATLTAAVDRAEAMRNEAQIAAAQTAADKADAESAKSAAENAKTAAETAKAQAEACKTQACQCASDALASKTAAASSASQAGNSATAASGSASTASTKASQAASSATSASNAKTAAESARDQAQQYAQQAQNVSAVPEIVNGLTETVAGKTLDATQGKIINDKIDGHINGKVYGGEHHGMRISGGLLQYYDGAAWQNVGSDMVAITSAEIDATAV